MSSNDNQLGSSFRDPSGFIFKSKGKIFRQINKSYQKHYDLLISSGLFAKLVNQKQLIAHNEVDASIDAYKIIEPEQIPFISYPYEWCFGQLKDAALLTLSIQKDALEHGMTLKDASSYNIQFLQGAPILIDTLSFESYQEGHPWQAYRQFCQHFLAPLALMHYSNIHAGRLSAIWLDGIPLEVAASFLPWKTKWKFSTLMHIHLHAKSQKHYERKDTNNQPAKMSKFQMLSLLDSLTSTIKKLTPHKQNTEWIDYYDRTNYSDESIEDKKRIVAQYINQLQPTSLWDLGGNDGHFSRLASDKNIPTISFDIDPLAVEQNYQQLKSKKEINLLPLVLDLTNPSPAIGWGNEERESLTARGPAHTLLALAIIHHLAISNNVPFEKIAHYFSQLGENLIIEFVPKTDSKVQYLLKTREDIFANYTKSAFEESFGNYFSIQKNQKVSHSERTIYLMKRHAKN
ncbi:MAG: SAM-dependent methyltransferase [Candidatus Abawacabacteria bacterium]|nr:SAM-dependent methyltransferase [Candidatus Abawacabacteria bacterium]